jgi:hypothetical protein
MNSSTSISASRFATPEARADSIRAAVARLCACACSPCQRDDW